jgi:hypothetical protein
MLHVHKNAHNWHSSLQYILHIITLINLNINLIIFITIITDNYQTFFELVSRVLVVELKLWFADVWMSTMLSVIPAVCTQT